MISTHKHSIFACILIALPLSFIGGYQIIGQSHDYLNYLKFFDLVRSTNSYFDISSRFEPAFKFSTYLLSYAGFSDQWIYTVFVGACVYLKYAAIPASLNNLITFLAFTFLYLSRYFILFEMTVLRAAIAFSLAFFAFFNKKDDELKKHEIGLLVLATLFHYSAIIFFPIYLTRNLNRRKIIIFSCLSFVLILAVKNIALNVLPEFFPVFNSYNAVRMNATFFPAPLMLDMMLAIFGFIFWKYNDAAMKCSIFGIFLSAVFHFAILDFSIIGDRIRELLSVFVLIYVARATMQQFNIFRLIIVIFSIFDGLINLYAQTVLDPLLS